MVWPLRRWYSSKEEISVTNAPTRWGNVSYVVRPQQASTPSLATAAAAFDVAILADFTQPVGSSSSGQIPQLKLRVHDPAGLGRQLRALSTDPNNDCVVSAEKPPELVLVTAKAPTIFAGLLLDSMLVSTI